MFSGEKKPEKIEPGHDAKTTKPEHATKEAGEAMPELIKDQQKHMEHLKGGGHSGITNEFGKPLLFDDTAHKPNVDQSVKDGRSTKADGSQPQESQKLNPEAHTTVDKGHENLSPSEQDWLASALANADASPSARSLEYSQASAIAQSGATAEAHSMEGSVQEKIAGAGAGTTSELKTTEVKTTGAGTDTGKTEAKP